MSREDAERELLEAFAAFNAAMAKAVDEGVDVLSVMLSAGVPLPGMPFPAAPPAPAAAGDGSAVPSLPGPPG